MTVTKTRNMRFVMKIDREKVRGMCIEYNFCTKMNCAEYEDMLSIDGKFNSEDIKEYEQAVLSIAWQIYSNSSDTSLEDISVGTIAGMIFNRCTLRWVE